MNKNNYLLVYFLLLFFILFFSSCNKDDGVNEPGDSINFIGTWEMTTITFIGTPDGDVELPASEDTRETFITFQSDGSYSIFMKWNENGVPGIGNDKGTWEAESGSLVITNPDTTMNMKYEVIDDNNVRIGGMREDYKDHEYPVVFTFTRYTGVNNYLKFQFIEDRFKEHGFVVLNSLDGENIEGVSYFYGDTEISFEFMDDERATFSMIGVQNVNGMRIVQISSDINAIAGTWRMSGRNTHYQGDVELIVNFPENTYDYMNIAWDGPAYTYYTSISGSQMIPDFQINKTHDGKLSIFASVYNRVPAK